MGVGSGASGSSDTSSHCLTPSTASHSSSGNLPCCAPCMYAGERTAPSGPQSGEVMGMVGAGWEVKAGPFVKAFASRPLALAKSQLAAA